MTVQRDMIVAVSDNHSVPVKLVQLRVAADSSVSVMVPFHPAKTGLLLKLQTPRFPTGNHGPFGDHKGTSRVVERYRVSVPVKLSVHASGFVQFSSFGKTAIRSGRGKDILAIPKGLGIDSNPLANPIATGPTFGAVFDAHDVCEVVTGKEKHPIMLFEEGDFFERDAHNGSHRHVYRVEGFFFHADEKRNAMLMRKGLTLTRAYSPLRPHWIVDFRVVELPSRLAFLGICVSRQHWCLDNGTGYMIGGPRDRTGEFSVAGLYPAQDDDDPSPSLIYEPI